MEIINDEASDASVYCQGDGERHLVVFLHVSLKICFLGKRVLAFLAL